MRLSLKLLILFVIFVACFELSNAKRGGGGSRGGGRGSSSRGTSYGGGSTRRGSSSSSSSSRGSSFGSTSYKKSKKQKAISTLKKVAVVGAVAYGAYQIGKMTSRFGSYGYGNNNPGMNFNTWNSWRKADGFLCRNDNDCTWLDNDLECQKVRDFGWSINSGWFGGEKPIGECSCDDGFEWDDDDLQCEVRGWGRGAGYLGMGIIGFVIFMLIAACCCCGICCFAVKKFMS